MTDGNHHQLIYQNNLPISYFNSLLFNLFYIRRPFHGSSCQNENALPGQQKLCELNRVSIEQQNPYFNTNNNFNVG